uniref:Uncharacterized protein n=1 Tax=viral metagenome TaxID=1070528 RepID=A0A6C0EYI7_9ZZZZ
MASVSNVFNPVVCFESFKTCNPLLVPREFKDIENALEGNHGFLLEVGQSCTGTSIQKGPSADVIHLTLEGEVYLVYADKFEPNKKSPIVPPLKEPRRCGEAPKIGYKTASDQWLNKLGLTTRSLGLDGTNSSFWFGNEFEVLCLENNNRYSVYQISGGGLKKPIKVFATHFSPPSLTVDVMTFTPQKNGKWLTYVLSKGAREGSIAKGCDFPRSYATTGGQTGTASAKSQMEAEKSEEQGELANSCKLIHTAPMPPISNYVRDSRYGEMTMTNEDGDSVIIGFERLQFNESKIEVSVSTVHGVPVSYSNHTDVGEIEGGQFVDPEWFCGLEPKYPLREGMNGDDLYGVAFPDHQRNVRDGLRYLEQNLDEIYSKMPELVQALFSATD